MARTDTQLFLNELKGFFIRLSKNDLIKIRSQVKIKKS